MNWIDKQDLDRFARMNGASDKFPRLIADLILATSPVPNAIRFLSDGAGRIRGFDGVLTSSGSKPFVPEGDSYWEFGCGEKIESKAREDITKRTEKIEAAQRARSTFVFASPLHYDNQNKLKEDFEAELQRDTGWKEVRVYDGAQLRHWLVDAPAVAATWARLEMQLYPEGVQGIEEFWQEYSSRFKNSLKEELLLAGRSGQAQELISRLERLTSDRISVKADSEDEAIAFVVAAIRQAEPATRLVLESRTLIVSTREAVRSVKDKDLVFVPSGDGLSLAGLLLERGPTILPLTRKDTAAGGIQLERALGHEFAEALSLTGLAQGPARQLASECGRSVTVLARRWFSVSRRPPHWGERTELVPALLCGGWDVANKDDVSVLAGLAGFEEGHYDKWQALIQPLLAREDAPLEFEGTVWKVRAPVDAFVTLGCHVERGQFSRLRTAAHRVFSDRKSSAGKSPVESLLSGPSLKHSVWLREGLATSLLLIATLGEAAGIGPALAAEGGAQAWVDEVVNSLPGLTSDVSLMASLQQALPLLAEAAPRPFVAAVERLVRDAPDDMGALFVERTEFISPTSDHVWLLWALEAVAWDTSMLTRVCVLLTRLAALDPGGKLLNRPRQSLREILLPWLPHTNAPLSVRLGAIKAVIRTNEAVGWTLALALLPEHHSSSSPTHHPVMREAGARGDNVTVQDRIAVHRLASGEVVRLVGTDPARWGQLIDRLPQLAEDDHAQAVKQLEHFWAAQAEQDRDASWRALRLLVTRHSDFPDADWTMKGERLAALTRLIERWVPKEPIKAAALIFDDPKYGHGGYAPAAAEAKRLEEEGELAVTALVTSHGLKGVLELAAVVQTPWAIGMVAARMMPDMAEGMSLCAAALLEGSPALNDMATAISAGYAARSSEDWSCLIRARSGDGLPPEQVGTLLRGMDDGPATWDFAEELGPGVDEAYWRRKRVWRFQDTADVERATTKLLGVGRAVAALSLMAGSEGYRAEAAFMALDMAVAEFNSGGVGGDSTASYSVEQVFDALRKRPDVDRDELARRELVWFALLVSSGRARPNLALFEVMARDPSLFVQFITTVFKKKDGSSEAETIDENRWRGAYNVLDQFRTVPGSSADGVDQKIMADWVRQALAMLSQAGLADIGAQYIGKILAHIAKDPDDDAWPAMPLRSLLEDLANDDLETGIAIERFNMRGAYMKGSYDGGKVERSYASEARSWAQLCSGWPRMADLLGKIAGDWDRFADREDVEARQRRMRE